MKNYLTLITIGWLMTLSIFACAQSPFSKVFYDSLGDGIQASAMVRTLDNGYLIAGNAGYNEGLILKIDSNGNALWNKKIKVDGYELFYCAVAAPDSGLFLAGSTFDTIGPHTEALCIRINSKGDTIWSKAIGQIGWEYAAYAVQETFDSGFIITGNFSSRKSDTAGIFTAKLSAKGNLQWVNRTILSKRNGFGLSVKQTADSGYIIIGDDDSGNIYVPSAFLMKLKPKGDIEWVKRYNLISPTECFGNDLEITSDGILCYLNTPNDIILMKTDLSGNVLSSNSLGLFDIINFSYSQSSKFHKTKDNGYVLCPFNIIYTGQFVKTDSIGILQWVQSIFLSPIDVQQTKNKGFLIVGNGPVLGEGPITTDVPQIGIIKTNSLGSGGNCISPGNVSAAIDTLVVYSVAVTSLTGGIVYTLHPSVTSLALITDSGCVSFTGGVHEINNNGLSVYPNPSTGSFTLTSVNTIVRGTVEIYNMVGERIFEENIFNTSKEEINLYNVAPGIYIVKVTDGNKEGIQKLIIQ
jgi:hypothetical protein